MMNLTYVWLAWCMDGKHYSVYFKYKVSQKAYLTVRDQHVLHIGIPWISLIFLVVKMLNQCFVTEQCRKVSLGIGNAYCYKQGAWFHCLMIVFVLVYFEVCGQCRGYICWLSYGYLPNWFLDNLTVKAVRNKYTYLVKWKSSLKYEGQSKTTESWFISLAYANVH